MGLQGYSRAKGLNGGTGPIGVYLVQLPRDLVGGRRPPEGVGI